MSSYQRASAMRALIINEIPQNGRIITRDIANMVLELQKKVNGFDFAYWAGGTFVQTLQRQISLHQIEIYNDFKAPWKLDLEDPFDWLKIEVYRGERASSYLVAVKHEIVEPFKLLGYNLKL